jgi:hypothetical protein
MILGGTTGGKSSIRGGNGGHAREPELAFRLPMHQHSVHSAAGSDLSNT